MFQFDDGIVMYNIRELIFIYLYISIWAFNRSKTRTRASIKLASSTMSLHVYIIKIYLYIRLCVCCRQLLYTGEVFGMHAIFSRTLLLFAQVYDEYIYYSASGRRCYIYSEFPTYEHICAMYIGIYKRKVYSIDRTNRYYSLFTSLQTRVLYRKLLFSRWIT